MELWKIYHRYSTAPDVDVPLRDPYPGDVAAIGNYRLLIVRDVWRVDVAREEFDEALIRFKCKRGPGDWTGAFLFFLQQIIEPLPFVVRFVYDRVRLSATSRIQNISG